MPERRKSTGTFEVERITGAHDVLDRLFVYGTMRRGQTARSIVANSIARCEDASTTGAIYAFPMGYPGFVEAAPGSVVGEVLWLTDLAATFGLLDAYEGADFARVLRRVTLSSGPNAGQPVWTWIYVLADPAAHALGSLIEDGDWVHFWTALGEAQ
ncbi:MAG TPA: gamma-glutamylcyclotransferase family protein [Kofleriaceae bacterium]|jgi:gamma-glutamylcyclotransferase (GGCT)/AIG2-like uncharacterized protein YtfP